MQGSWAAAGGRRGRRGRAGPAQGLWAGSGGGDGSLGWSPLFSGDCVTPSFPGHLLGVSVVPVAFLMLDKLLHFIQL